MIYFKTIVLSAKRRQVFLLFKNIFCVLILCQTLLLELRTQQGIRHNPGPQGVLISWRRNALNK
jgi:hypothetical protein